MRGFTIHGIWLAACLLALAALFALPRCFTPGIRAGTNPDYMCYESGASGCATCALTMENYQCLNQSPPNPYGACVSSPGTTCVSDPYYCGGNSNVYDCNTPAHKISVIGSGCGNSYTMCYNQ